MSPRLLSAAALLALTGAIHVTLGAVDVYDPLRAQVTDTELRVYLGLLWHFVTAFFALGACGMAWAALAPGPRRQTANGIALMALAMGALFLAYGVALLGEPWTAPQWTITLVIAALTLWPARPKMAA